jgi:hypothetical protein
VVIGVGGWGVPTEALPRTPEEIKAYLNEINQAPGLPVVKWFQEFLDLMFQNDNWQNVVYDEYLARTSSFTRTKRLLYMVTIMQPRMPSLSIITTSLFQTTSLRLGILLA